jgi:hypothetical protein
MSITWGSGQIAFARDGVTLGTVSYAGAYAPKPLRVRLGSPRNDGIYPGAAFMPAGLTFRDVLVSGDAGTETPACGASAPDAGTGGSGAGGAPAGGADAGATGIELGALEDVTAASWEPAVFSDPNDLNIEAAAEGTPTAVVYLRFPAVTGVIKQAILRLHTQAYVSASGGSGVPCAIADDAWHETTLTWSTRPAVGSACAGAPSTVDPDAEVAWDVTALLAPGGPHYDLALVSHDPDGAHYVSKELGGAVSGPRLHVVLDTASPGTGGASGAGASGSGGASSWGTPAGGAPAGAGRGVHETGSAAASGCATRPGLHGGEAVALCSLLLALTGARRGGWRLKGSDRSRPRRCPSPTCAQGGHCGQTHAHGHGAVKVQPTGHEGLMVQ